MNAKKLRYGEIVITGYGQLMHDSTWSAKCVITDNAGSHTDERILTGNENYKTEQEAVSAALDIGANWVNKEYPQV